MAQILGTNQKVEIDFANGGVGTKWESLICLRNSSVDTTNDVTSEQTNCGVLSAIGEPSMALNFDAICETAPSTTVGSEQVSYKKILDASVNKTLIRIRVSSPVQTGSSMGLFYHHEFSGYVTSLTFNQASGEFINFSGTIQSTGALDIIA